MLLSDPSQSRSGQQALDEEAGTNRRLRPAVLSGGYPLRTLATVVNGMLGHTDIEDIKDDDGRAWCRWLRLSRLGQARPRSPLLRGQAVEDGAAAPPFPSPQDLILIRHICGMRSCCWSEVRPAHQGRGVDRGCPLDTGIVRLIWHTSGTADGERSSGVGRAQPHGEAMLGDHCSLARCRAVRQVVSLGFNSGQV